MSTTTDGIEEVASESPRSITKLLALGTYQGMTDEEIDSIINYKMKVAFDTALGTAQIAIATEQAEAIVVNGKAQFEKLHEIAQQAVAFIPTMAVIPSE